jgi:hypothetical protein
VSVPGAKVKHPWWRNGRTCYSQINGWAWGDSLCITQWPDKTFFVCPNWIEYITFVVFPLILTSGNLISGGFIAGTIIMAEHLFLCARYFYSAQQITGGGWLRSFSVALCAGTIHSAQEVIRVLAHLRRGALSNICRRVDWNDGQLPRFKLDAQLGSVLRFGLFLTINWIIVSA